jgi:2-polyprenyl-6-methoxyphenol hydroxylase-like FAD-dependent oxidoreductase
MRATVVGAGMAGLVTARQLALAGWKVDVLEKSPGPRRDGYMMDFFGPGVEAAERIGLLPRLSEVAYPVTAVEYVDSSGRVTARIDYDRFSRFAGGRVLSLLRPDMERAAIAALDDVPAGRVRLHYDARVSDVTTGDGGVIRIGDARGVHVEPADVLIGADGIHSEVRARLFGSESDFLRPLGMRAAAFIVPDAELNAGIRNRFVLTDTVDRTVGFYGLRTGEVTAFFVYREPPGQSGSSGSRSTRDRLRREFFGLDPTVDRLLALCPAEPYDDLVAQVVMPRWHTDRAVLVGDAAGAVSLLAGQGGSLAVAAGALLGELLGPIQEPGGISPALAEFQRRWQPVVTTAQASGRRAASTFLPKNRMQLLLRRWTLRATRVPGVDRLVARPILRSIAK